jgi:hypothetical protein
VDCIGIGCQCRFGKRRHTSPLGFGDDHIYLIGPDFITDGHSAKALIGQLIDPPNELLVGQSPIVQPMIQHWLIGWVRALFPATQISLIIRRK